MDKIYNNNFMSFKNFKIVFVILLIIITIISNINNIINTEKDKKIKNEFYELTSNDIYSINFQITNIINFSNISSESKLQNDNKIIKIDNKKEIDMFVSFLKSSVVFHDSHGYHKDYVLVIIKSNKKDYKFILSKYTNDSSITEHIQSNEFSLYNYQSKELLSWMIEKNIY